jgi:hypothetical protein
LREKFEEGEEETSLESISAASCVDRAKKKSIEKKKKKKKRREEEKKNYFKSFCRF